jgi:hypothetical protein
VLLPIGLMALGALLGAALMSARVPRYWLVVLFSGAVRVMRLARVASIKNSEEQSHESLV